MKHGTVFLLAILSLLLLPKAACAQFQVNWFTIDGGGGTSAGGTFVLAGTMGQPDAADSTGGSFIARGGFWSVAGPTTPRCGTSDFDGDGDYGTDADIEAFFACLAGVCCPTCFERGSDFDGDGDYGTDADIESFFRVLAGGPC